MNQTGASQDVGGISWTPGKETHAVRAGWGLSPSPERRAPGWPALPSAHRAAPSRPAPQAGPPSKRLTAQPRGEARLGPLCAGWGGHSPCAPCRYPALSPLQFSLLSLKDQGVGSATPASQAPGRAPGGHSPFCSRRYSAFSRIHSSAFTRASASFRMYWGRAQGHSEGTPRAQPQACPLRACQSGSRPPIREGTCAESGLTARHTLPSLGQPGGCTLPSSSQAPGTGARAARLQARGSQRRSCADGHDTS